MRLKEIHENMPVYYIHRPIGGEPTVDLVIIESLEPICENPATGNDLYPCTAVMTNKKLLLELSEMYLTEQEAIDAHGKQS